MNSLTATELKRRGMAGIEAALRRGPVYLVKRSKPVAVVLSGKNYARLSGARSAEPVGMTAIQWLLNRQSTGTRGTRRVERALRAARNGWM